MKIAILPASPQTAAAVIRSLLASDSANDLEIEGIYRDPAKVPAEFKSHASFKAKKGDLSDASSLDLTGIDVVLTITPPVYDGRDLIAQSAWCQRA